MATEAYPHDDIPRLAYRQGWQDALEALHELSAWCEVAEILERIGDHVDGPLLEYALGSEYRRPELEYERTPDRRTLPIDESHPEVAVCEWPPLPHGSGYVRGATVWHLIELRGERTIITRCGEAVEGAEVVPELTNGERVCRKCQTFAAGMSLRQIQGLERA